MGTNGKLFLIAIREQQPGSHLLTNFYFFSNVKVFNRGRDIFHKVNPNIGTTRWMPPEVFCACEVANEENDEGLLAAHPFKVDVYSFSMTCCDSLIGALPFENIGLPEPDKLLSSENPFRAQLSETSLEIWTSLINRCWPSDPSKSPKVPDICRRLRLLKDMILSGCEKFKIIGLRDHSTKYVVFVSPKSTHSTYEIHPICKINELQRQSDYYQRNAEFLEKQVLLLN